jgi:hypothetical protein
MLPQESGRLLGELTKACVENQKTFILNGDDVYRIGQLFIRILTHCRHRVSKPSVLFSTEFSNSFCNGSMSISLNNPYLHQSKDQLKKYVAM